MSIDRQTMTEEKEPAPAEEPTVAARIGRGAGFLARFAVRGALRSKTLRDQLQDARREADRPPEEG